MSESPSLPQVLLVHEDTGSTRLIRESLENFCVCEVDTTADPIYAFELALQRSYDLFVFSLTLPELKGEIVYEFISKAYRHSSTGVKIAPAVIYVATNEELNRANDLKTDARVKGILMKPIRIDKVLGLARQVLPEKDPTQM